MSTKKALAEPLSYFFSFVLLVAGVASAVTGQASALRLLCGMGRDRLLPYRIFGYLHPRLGTHRSRACC